MRKILIAILISTLSSCIDVPTNPQKPFIIIEKSFGDDNGIKCWRYVYSSSNNFQRKFIELTEKYNIGDTIK